MVRRKRWFRDPIIVTVLVLVLLIVFTVTAYATGWAYVWGWGPSACSRVGGTASWIWDSVIKQPNWLCKYPAK